MTNNDIKKYINDVKDFPKKGIIFKDISPILKNPNVMKHIIKEFSKHLNHADVIIGPDARGFLFGVPLAIKNNKPFVMVRKKGKLPGEVISFEYELEYATSTLEILKNSIKPNQKVVIVDDLLATGGTVEAIQKLIKSLGAKVVNKLFVIELEFLKGKEKIGNNYLSLVKF
jgi:adenine phosphoribosyltransferase